MLFCIIATDKPDALQLRLANREDHIKYWKESGCVALGGPFTKDDGETMSGSLLVIEAENREEAESIFAKDPFSKVGVFGSHEIRAWKWTLAPRN